MAWRRGPLCKARPYYQATAPFPLLPVVCECHRGLLEKAIVHKKPCFFGGTTKQNLDCAVFSSVLIVLECGV